MMKRKLDIFVIILGLCLSLGARGEVYHYIPLQELNITDGELPASSTTEQSARRISWQRISMLTEFMRPYAVAEGDIELYVTFNQSNDWQWNQTADQSVAALFLAVRAPEGQQVNGLLFVPESDWQGMRRISFSIEADHVSEANAREQFLQSKEQHYRRLMNMAIPGAAWFRHKQIAAWKERMNQAYTKLSPLSGSSDSGTISRPGDLAETYSLFTGGRAVSENLQLDRALRVRSDENKQTVPLDQIRGVTTAEIDWDQIIQGMSPETDTLASAIPKDQHVLFFPSFGSMLDMIDEATEQGTPVLRLLEPRSEDARTRERYERQLCLKADEISRRLGPKLVTSVAYTGSDPYLRTGSDLAILFEAKSPIALSSLIAARQKAALEGDIKSVSGSIEGVRYQGVTSPKRTVSSYLVQAGDIVIVTNSLAQLEAILKTIQGETESVADAPEYTFFRDRYKKGEDETAFLVLTDSAIRRWCSPQWRIAASRRTRAAAALSEIKARFLKDLAEGTVEPGPINIEDRPALLGALKLTEQGISSSRYGTLDFLTPIVELEITEATQAEQRAYDLFRQRYERNWRGTFDPIAIRFVLEENEIAADMTVRPLIAGSDYRQLMAVTGNAAVAPQYGDPHDESMIHMVMSLNPESEPVRRIGNFAIQMAPGMQVKPLGWVGDWLSVYVDEDPLWKNLQQEAEAAENTESVFEDFMENHLWEIPVAVTIDVQNSFKLTGFITALRAFIEQTAPGMTAWETRKHGELSYVRVSPTEQARQDILEEENWEDMGVYYAITPGMLIISLDEDVVKRALNRQAERQAAASEKKEAPEFGQPWLGKSISAQANEGALTFLQAIYEDSLNIAYQRRS